MNILYAGSPTNSADILKFLILSKKINIKGVITQNNKTGKRGNKLIESPVAIEAKKHNIPVFMPTDLNEDEFKEISLIYDLFFNYQQVICIMSDKIDNKEILSNHGLQYLFENFCKSINYEKGKNLNDLYLLLKQKSKYIGNLFDKKLK